MWVFVGAGFVARASRARLPEGIFTYNNAGTRVRLLCTMYACYGCMRVSVDIRTSRCERATAIFMRIGLRACVHVLVLTHVHFI